MLQFQPKAEIIADSINPYGDRMTTFVLTYHRLVHSELLTHRSLSKNSSSSRAIPLKTMIERVISDNVYPLYWGKNKAGMSASEEISEEQKQLAIAEWDEARKDAIRHAQFLSSIGVHKQTVNRLLEPFSSITVICSGTEYQNFFEQRCHENAQPEIQAIAFKMQEAYNSSQPKQLEVGDWHIPFISPVKDKDLDPDIVLKVAVGRCARVSYLNHGGDRNPTDDIKLCDKLWYSSPKHWSPLEHVARAASRSDRYDNLQGFQHLRHALRVGDLKYAN